MSKFVEIETIVSQPFEENSYVVWRPGHSSCFVVDPGLEPDLILNTIAKHKLNVEAILNTHGHADHIAGNQALKEAFPNAPLIIGAGDAKMLSDGFLNLSALLGAPIVSPPADKTVDHGDTFECIGLSIEVRAITGHSPGHVVFILPAGHPPIVFGGDVLMKGSVGRSDFPGGNHHKLITGIHDHLYSLHERTIVYPGHGPATTVGMEKATNPFTTGVVFPH